MTGALKSAAMYRYISVYMRGYMRGYIRMHTASNGILERRLCRSLTRCGSDWSWRNCRQTQNFVNDSMRCPDEAGEVSLQRTADCSSFVIRRFVSRQSSVVSHQPANPPTHISLFFFERMHACFSLGIPRSLSLFRCCLVRSSGSFKIHTRLCLPRVTEWSDGERNIMGPQAGSIGVITQERVYRYRKR
jgi:hypothetical protein